MESGTSKLPHKTNTIERDDLQKTRNDKIISTDFCKQVKVVVQGLKTFLLKSLQNKLVIEIHKQIAHSAQTAANKTENTKKA